MIKATTRMATLDETGRSCPYCRFTIKDGIEVVVCPSCAAVEHQDCWLENGGCAVVACVSGPLAAHSDPSAHSAQTASVVSSLPPSAPLGARGERRTTRSPSVGLIAAVLILALSVVAAAVAVVISGSRESTPQGRVVVVSPGSTGAKAAAADTPATAEPEKVTPTKTPNKSTTTAKASGANKARAMQRLLTDYYGAVVRGDFASAWALLSPSYKSWKASHGGYAKWLQQEQDNRAHLHPSGLNVAVRSFDHASGVATIYVSGMRYRKAGRPTCAYAGVTWARRVEGRWYYDQGYLQNPTRAAEWRPRSNATLGVPCETSGY